MKWFRGKIHGSSFRLRTCLRAAVAGASYAVPANWGPPAVPWSNPSPFRRFWFEGTGIVEGQKIELRDRTSGTTIGTQITIADTSVARLAGLLGRRQLDPGCGLLIRPCCGIHTFGMLFSIDAVALDKSLRVLKLWPGLAPFRVTSPQRKAHSILELPAGQISHCRIHVGDQLELV